MSLKLSSVQHVQVPEVAEGNRTKVERDDLLICITGALTGNVVHVSESPPETSFVNQHVALLRPNRRTVHPRYLAYSLHSELGKAQFKAGEYGGTKQGLGLEDIKSAVMPLPPISEQEAICTELDANVARNALSLIKLETQIFLLREYRTRLIADVVTGKLDVREAAARLPDEHEGAEALDEADALTEGNEEIADDLDPIREEAEA